MGTSPTLSQEAAGRGEISFLQWSDGGYANHTPGPAPGLGVGQHKLDPIVCVCLKRKSVHEVGITVICNHSPRASDTLLWPLKALHTHGTQTDLYTQKNKIIKN